MEPVGDMGQEDFEREWRAVHVRVEWLRSPRGRLDAVFRYCDIEAAKREDSAPLPE